MVSEFAVCSLQFAVCSLQFAVLDYVKQNENVKGEAFLAAHCKLPTANYSSLRSLATGMFICSRYLATVRRAIL